jgi:hypothetical protein
MNTPSSVESRSIAAARASRAETVVGFAILGLLLAGAVGVWKAMSMARGIDVLLCLLGAVVAFGAVYYIYFRKD